jgi:hypothetical protein
MAGISGGDFEEPALPEEPYVAPVQPGAFQRGFVADSVLASVAHQGQAVQLVDLIESEEHRLAHWLSRRISSA